MKEDTAEFTGYQIRKNQPKPNLGKVADKWDRLSKLLDEGDDLKMGQSEANSFAIRARRMGFVVVVKRMELTDEQKLAGEKDCLVWFGGRKK